MRQQLWKLLVGYWWGAIIIMGIVMVVGVLFPEAAKADDGAPTIPHDIAGKEQCLLCHGIQGVAPVPPSHASYDEGLCLTCHSAAGESASAPAPTPVPSPPLAPVPTPTPTPSPTPTPATQSTESCQQCHSQPNLSMALTDGETLPLYINPQVYAGSVHGDKLLCMDCHTTITGYPHPKWDIPNRREYNIAQYELCKRCHFDNYTKTLDSIHYEKLSEGDLETPICTDCHGAHDVTSPSQPRAKISKTCSQCHQDVYQEYVNSVHGQALIKENNTDVPVCTDCHQSHTIEDPRTASFRLRSVQLCSNCHSNAKLMEKYGISTDVVRTYLNDFHGRTVALMEKQDKDIWVEEAVCTDCHGIHDIQQVDNPNSPVIKGNLEATCGKCHADINVNFPGAWLSHYEPSINKAPLIFFVRWFYRILIPFILVGLSVHVLLDLWRRITNR